MSTPNKNKPLSPKQQEIQDRPGRILHVARIILKNEGYTSLTIDRIFGELKCSRPPIYELFASREDVVIGVAIEDAIQRWKLLKRAVTFEGNHREKLVAMSAFFNHTYPKHLKILAVLQPNSIRKKATEKNRQTLEEYEARSFEIEMRLVEGAIEVGDLVLPEGESAAMVAYPLLCLTFGGHSFESRYPTWSLHQREFDRQLAVNWGFRTMLDGFRWKPLSTEWDYPAMLKRAYKELDVLAYVEETEAEKPSSKYKVSDAS